MKRTEYTLFATALGTCGIAWKESAAGGLAVTAFQLPEATEEGLWARRKKEPAPTRAHRIPSPIAALIERMIRHFAGDLQEFGDVEVDLGGFGGFARQVYAAARKIPPGRTMTYGEVAAAIKRPKAARAVGQALARNPIPLIIPCHRVLAAGNRPGGFSAPGGLATKKKMLAGEGAAVAT